MVNIPPLLLQHRSFKLACNLKPKHEVIGAIYLLLEVAAGENKPIKSLFWPYVEALPLHSELMMSGVIHALMEEFSEPEVSAEQSVMPKTEAVEKSVETAGQNLGDFERADGPFPSSLPSPSPSPSPHTPLPLPLTPPLHSIPTSNVPCVREATLVVSGRQQGKTSSVKSSQRNAETPVGIEENVLLAMFPTEDMLTWTRVYPDATFLQREFVKAFAYYRRNPAKQPRKVSGWIRAMSSWYDRSWPQHQKTIKANTTNSSDLDSWVESGKNALEGKR